MQRRRRDIRREKRPTVTGVRRILDLAMALSFLDPSVLTYVDPLVHAE